MNKLVEKVVIELEIKEEPVDFDNYQENVGVKEPCKLIDLEIKEERDLMLDNHDEYLDGSRLGNTSNFIKLEPKQEDENLISYKDLNLNSEPEDFRQQSSANLVKNDKSGWASVIKPESSEMKDEAPLRQSVYQGFQSNHNILSSSESSQIPLKKVKVFKCTVCCEDFESQAKLTEHKNIHPKDFVFICDICKKTFNAKQHLAIHIIAHGDAQFKCKICHKSFKYRQSLNFHMKKHSDNQHLTCKICKKRYYKKSHLVTHLIAHMGAVFKCNVCDKAFKHKISLTQHMAVHSDDNSLVCKICKKKCCTKSHLISHIRTHSGPHFKCDVCKREFIYKSCLARHLLTHKDVRTYFKCNFCELCYYTKSILSKHVKEVHKK